MATHAHLCTHREIVFHGGRARHSSQLSHLPGPRPQCVAALIDPARGTLGGARGQPELSSNPGLPVTDPCVCLFTECPWASDSRSVKEPQLECFYNNQLGFHTQSALCQLETIGPRRELERSGRFLRQVLQPPGVKAELPQPCPRAERCSPGPVPSPQP